MKYLICTFGEDETPMFYDFTCASNKSEIKQEKRWAIGNFNQLTREAFWIRKQLIRKRTKLKNYCPVPNKKLKNIINKNEDSE